MATYEISSVGQLTNLRSKVTRGFLFGGKRWAAVPGSGIVNLHAAARIYPGYHRGWPPHETALAWGTHYVSWPKHYVRSEAPHARKHHMILHLLGHGKD